MLYASLYGAIPRRRSCPAYPYSPSSRSRGRSSMCSRIAAAQTMIPATITHCAKAGVERGGVAIEDGAVDVIAGHYSATRPGARHAPQESLVRRQAALVVHADDGVAEDRSRG